MPNEEKVWKLAKNYRVMGGAQHRFPRFLFVPPDEVSDSLLDRLSEQDIEILNKDCMQDKDHVFNVVYDRTVQHFGAPLEVIDEGPYLIFRQKQPEEKDEPITA